jgi:hypothetical protein
MKKEYVKPEMVMEELLLEGMLALSGNLDEKEEPLSNEHRGSWGDLWN